MKPAAVAVTAVIAGQLAPRALADPRVRRHVPALSGRGRPDHVALTFDDGPDPAVTPRVLATLAELDVCATFFLLGTMVERAGDLPAELIAAGHELAVHGWDHGAQITRTPHRWREHLSRTRTLIEDRAGGSPILFRPPYGKLNGALLWAARAERLRPVLWSAWGEDWTGDCTAESVLTTLAPDLDGGATILLHDSDRQSAPGSSRATLGALAPLVTGLRERGLTVGPLRDHGL